MRIGGTMKLIYVDDKGPQNKFRKSNPFDSKNKLKKGSDNMDVYVANAIMIDSKEIDNFERQYKIIEEEYRDTRRQLTGELKGQHLLMNKFFEYSIASMKTNEIEFFQSLFDLLIMSEAENLFFTINKMSIVIDSKLNEWLLDISKENLFSSVLLKYILTKYALIEASEEVIDSLLDNNSSVKDVLLNIQNDMENFIEKHSEISRMAQTQIPAYNEILEVIEISLNTFLLKESSIENIFNWEKYMWGFDLWLTEKYQYAKTKDEIEVYLDDGIPLEPFHNLKILNINEERDSNNVVGLRATDMVTALLGKMLSKLTEDIGYDRNSPGKTKHLSKEWFDLNKRQFRLIKAINKYIFQRDKIYIYGVDTYFDEGLLLETYIKYIASYGNFYDYKPISAKNHVFKHLRNYLNSSWAKYNEALGNESEAIRLFGSYRESISLGISRPL